jgi:glyoxylase-like metal-dependent hydrolase (beta-lactamase superfamily II)/rhodanese-related sulfurtransferase
MSETITIDTNTLRTWLETGKKISILDIRPMQERAEWFIPQSIHLDAYDKLKSKDTTALQGLYLDKSIPVVTVCAGGKTSMIAADMLQQKGYNAFSLQGGMKGWSLAWNTAYQSFGDFEVWQVRRTGKGCLSYIISSNNEAIIIDASLPVEVYAQLINQHQLSVKYVIETHIHADHLSRSKEAAEYFKAPLYLPTPNKVQFEFNPVKAGTNFSIGGIVLQSIPSPGHTLESFSFYVNNSLLITGDTLFTNGVGRPDLKSNTEESREKAHLLYQSLNKLLSLPGNVIVLPAHANKPPEFDSVLIKTTIGDAKKNIAMLQSSEEDFIDSLLQKIPPTPPNFLVIAEKNISGSYEGINPVDLEAGANRCAVS